MNQPGIMELLEMKDLHLIFSIDTKGLKVSLMTVSKKRLSLCPEIISSVFSSWKKYLTDS
jgi:hypothetical protein